MIGLLIPWTPSVNTESCPVLGSSLGPYFTAGFEQAWNPHHIQFCFPLCFSWSSGAQLLLGAQPRRGERALQDAGGGAAGGAIGLGGFASDGMIAPTLVPRIGASNVCCYLRK